jgi:hypothetical protein
MPVAMPEIASSNETANELLVLRLVVMVILLV